MFGVLLSQDRITHVRTTETGKHAFVKFLYVLLIFLIYALFVISKYGAEQGIAIAALTWSFFVFCTPIADAGFLLAFPIRLITGTRMLYVQLFAYLIAFLIVLVSFLYFPAFFEKTLILKLFKLIILTPIPYWSILILSFIGTLASIYFGDELMDVTKHIHRKKYHKHALKYEFVLTLGIILLTIALYKVLIDQFSINIDLF